MILSLVGDVVLIKRHGDMKVATMTAVEVGKAMRWEGLFF